MSGCGCGRDCGLGLQKQARRCVCWNRRRSGFGKASSRAGKPEDEDEDEGVVVVVVVVVVDAGVAGPALFPGGTAAAAAVVARFLLHLRMAGYFPFAAADPADWIPVLAGLVRNSWAFVVAGPQRKGWRASGPWWAGMVVT